MLELGLHTSKTLLDASHKYVEANSVFGDIGIQVTGIKADVPKMIERKKRGGFSAH